MIKTVIWRRVPKETERRNESKIEYMYIVQKREWRTNIETDTYLIESVVLALHVPVLDEHSENMFVERAREITLQQFVVVDGLGDHMPHKLPGKKRWFYMIILRDKINEAKNTDLSFMKASSRFTNKTNDLDGQTVQ